MCIWDIPVYIVRFLFHHDIPPVQAVQYKDRIRAANPLELTFPTPLEV